jgi:hypothetical protein
MKRVCTRCHRPFTKEDLARNESKGMESERKAKGLDGVRFIYYHCPCGMNDIFVDILPREDEIQEDFERRRAEMESTVRSMHEERVEAVVMPVARR